MEPPDLQAGPARVGSCNSWGLAYRLRFCRLGTADGWSNAAGTHTPYQNFAGPPFLTDCGDGNRRKMGAQAIMN